jgi:hypothetical protein
MTTDTIAHEAGHVVGFIAAAGMIPREVRVDRPDADALGWVRADFRHHSADYGYLIGVLMGPLAEGRVIAWPPSKDASGDERAAALLVDFLDLSESDYKAALWIAGHLLEEPETKGMHALVCQALSRVPVITGPQLRELLDIDQEENSTP